MLDAQWLPRLHSHGLLRGSFRPPDVVVIALRAYHRQRLMLISYASSHIQHMQKAMEQMNVKLAEVVREITGLTGMRIITIEIRCQEPISGTLMQESRFSVPDTFFSQPARPLPGNPGRSGRPGGRLHRRLRGLLRLRQDRPDLAGDFHAESGRHIIRFPAISCAP